MESYDKFYTKFVTPPPAPIFHPTAEEFADPIEYVAKIRHEAEPYGVIKIIPPPNFKPPFALQTDSFQFMPRIQRLNEIDAIHRERAVFLAMLTEFWNIVHKPMEMPIIDHHTVDLYKLHRLVKEAGGYDAVEKEKSWPAITKKLGLKSSNKVKELHRNLLEPYALLSETTFDNDEEEDTKPYKEETNGSISMHGGKRPAGRMMAGLRSSPRKIRKVERAPIALDDMVCVICKKGDNDDKLLTCVECERLVHTSCCVPRLTKIPSLKNPIKCPKCIVSTLSGHGASSGFMDCHKMFTLDEFKKLADNFKHDHFKKHKNVQSDDIEKEFWKCVHNTAQNVSVYYGADLITSKVGSGFYIKSDHRGQDARIKNEYAKHQWNLNNMPVISGSVLSHIKEQGISGMMVPWIYVGMCFSTFCWHTEDHWTYSINYNHLGEKKIWYGIGGQDAEKFEQIVRDLAPELASNQKDIFHHMTTAINPYLLRTKGVNVTTVQQGAGEFVITFPRAYHAGYNEGFNIAEAVNFAPVDWLKSGRLSVSEYAKVKRPCVFSHDELIMKITSVDRLGIALSLATLEELLAILDREKVGKRLLKQKGVKKEEYQQFEEIADDFRSCRKCRTTMFVSALYCKHENAVCLNHIDDICETCSLSECIYKYRHTVDEIQQHVETLKERTTKYFEWADRVEKVLDNAKKKPEISHIEEFIQEARSDHFPQTDLFLRLLTIQKKVQSVRERAGTILTAKMRTRKETRIQRVDSRLDIQGVKELLDEIASLPVKFDGIYEQLEDVLTRVEEWCDAVDDAILNKSPRERLDSLRLKGEKFEIKTNQIEMLQKQIKREEWRQEANQIIEYAPSEGMEADADFFNIHRWSLTDVQKLICDGTELDGLEKEIENLMDKMRAANRQNSLAEKMKMTPHLTETIVNDLWKAVREHDWCTASAIDWLRKEKSQIMDFAEEDYEKDCNLKILTEVVEKRKKSRILSSTTQYQQANDMKQKLEKFTERIASLFKPSSSYYNIVEILCDRDDLPQLVEGRAIHKELKTSVISQIEEWDQLYETIDSVEELETHLTKIEKQELELLNKLKEYNTTRKLKETCVCGLDKDGEEETVSCMVCKGRYHASCCEWKPFFGNLPLGSFLCDRCLRGRRPDIADSQMAERLPPENCWEVILLKRLNKKVYKLSNEVRDSLKNLPNSEVSEEWKQKTEQVLERVLGAEVFDYSIKHLVSKLISLVYGDLMVTQSTLMEKVRDRPVPSKKPHRIFLTESSKCRKRNGTMKNSSSKDKKRKSGSTEDSEQCSKEFCKKPYGAVSWVQCGDCEKWFHHICAGLTVAAISQIPVYRCSRCTCDSP